MRVRVAAVAAALIAASALPSAGAAPRAAGGRLAADTTVTWRGTAGLRLAVRGGALPTESMTLFVRGGTYAFVGMLADPQPTACKEATPFAHCYGTFLATFPGAATIRGEGRPGHDHLTNIANDGILVGRRLDLYLFTDGEATLRLRPRGGYTGRTAYVAAGRVRGVARELPRDCAPVCGETPATRVVAGGATYDYGRTPGHLVTLAYRGVQPEAVAPNRPMMLQTCYYPSLEQRDTSADPADHPLGCDPVSDSDAVGSAVWETNGLRLAAWSYASWNIGDQTGKRYIGFRSGGPAVTDTWDLGYGLWFNYGIT